MNSPTYTNPNTGYDSSTCLANGETYVFSIYDSGNNGISCTPTAPSVNCYQVMIDNTSELAGGPADFTSDRKLFSFIIP
jgi:hypothetical protein